MAEKYDFIVSLGENCISSGNLRRNKLQYESFPFDWIVIPFNQAVEMLQTHFAGFLELENLRLSARAENHDRYLDTVHQIEFVHDFDSDIEPIVNFEKIKNKYNRRIERLYRRINEAKSILIVVSSITPVSDGKLTEYQQRLQKIFPHCRLKLLFFELPQGEKSIKKQTISPAIEKIVISTPNPNDWNALREDYADCLRQYRLNFWSRLHYIWPDICFRLKKQFLKMAAFLVPFPAYRRHLHLKVKKNIFE